MAASERRDAQETGAEKMMPAVRTIGNRYRVFVNAEGRVVAQKQ